MKIEVVENASISTMPKVVEELEKDSLCYIVYATGNNDTMIRIKDLSDIPLNVISVIFGSCRGPAQIIIIKREKEDQDE